MPEFVCPHCHHVYQENKGNCPTDGSILIEVPKMNDLSGEVFKKKYKLEEVLGHGGFGSVYKGTHLVLGRPVAIKVLRAEFRSDSTMVKRFFNEARVVTRLTNPHTINTFDLDQTEEGLLFMVMDFVEGVTLRKLARSEGDPPGRIEWRRAIRLLLQVCDSLAEAHEAGVVHRDLKPDNIMISNRGGEADFATVLDFGIAKVLEGTDMANITGTGMILGSPAYMSPEQIVGGDLDARSDLYSLGAVAYHVISGTLPCTAKQTAAILQEKVQALPPRPTKRVPGINIPVELEDIVMRLLALSPAHRPSSAGEVKAEFQRIADLYSEVEDSPEAYQQAFRANQSAGDASGTRGYPARGTAQTAAGGTLPDSPAPIAPGAAPHTQQVPTAAQHQMPQDMPTSAGQQPMQTGQQPMQTGQQPMQTGQQPMQTGQQPMPGGYAPQPGQPVVPGQQPMQTGYVQQPGQPMMTGQQPMQTGYVQQPGQPMMTGQQPMQTGYGPQMGQPMQTGMGTMQQPYMPPGAMMGQPGKKSKMPLIIGVLLVLLAAAAFGFGYKYMGFGGDGAEEEAVASKANKDTPAATDEKQEAEEEKAQPAAAPIPDVVAQPDVQPIAPEVQSQEDVRTEPEVAVVDMVPAPEEVQAEVAVEVATADAPAAEIAEDKAVDLGAGGTAAVPEKKTEVVPEKKAAPVKKVGTETDDKSSKKKAVKAEKKKSGGTAAQPAKEAKKAVDKKEPAEHKQPQKIIIIHKQPAPSNPTPSGQDELRNAEDKLRTAEQLRRAAEEIRRAEQEKRRAQEEKRGAEEEKRKAEEEKRKAEEEKRKAEEERRKAEEERRKAEEERRKAQEERRKGAEANENAKVKAEKRKLEEGKRKLEEEKRKLAEEKQKAQEKKKEAGEAKKQADKAKEEAAEEKKKAQQAKKKAAEAKKKKQEEADKKAEEVEDYHMDDDEPPESKKSFDELDDGW